MCLVPANGYPSHGSRGYTAVQDLETGLKLVDMQRGRAAQVGDQPRDVRYWWVNHKRTHRAELDGEFLWSPKKKHSSADNESSHNMTKIMPGDVVFAFSFSGGT